jgi:hypothetical protein
MVATYKASQICNYMSQSDEKESVFYFQFRNINLYIFCYSDMDILFSYLLSEIQNI